MSHILKGPWSYSRATSCARSMYMEKVVKAPLEPRPERFIDIDRRDLGSILHQGADFILKQIIAGEEVDVGKVTQACLGHEEKGKRIYFHLTPHAVYIEESLQRFVDRFRCDWEMDVPTRDAIVREQVLGNEMRLAIDAKDEPWLDFWTCPEDGWRGIVDYAEVEDDTLIIIDFKNRPAIFTEAELHKDEQLSGYAHLVMRQYPGQYKHVRAGIYYFEFGYTQLVDLTFEEIEDNVARLKARATAKEGLKKDEIGPEPGYGKCQYCDYIATCEAGEEYVAGGILAPTDHEQAVKTAKWLMVEEEKIKAAKAALKLFACEFGPITIDDKTQMGNAVSLTGVSYDKDMTLRIIKRLMNEGKLDGGLSQYTNLNTNAVKKIAKREDVQEALEPATTPSARQKFETFRTATKRGVRTVKEGKKTVVHPDDVKKPRKTRVRVRIGGRK